MEKLILKKHEKIWVLLIAPILLSIVLTVLRLYTLNKGILQFEFFETQFFMLFSIYIWIVFAIIINKTLVIFPLTCKKSFFGLIFHMFASLVFAIVHNYIFHIFSKFVNFDFSRYYFPSFVSVFKAYFKYNIMIYWLIIGFSIAYDYYLRTKQGLRRPDDLLYEQKPEKIDYFEQILVKSEGMYHVLKKKEIKWIEASADYLVINSLKGKYIVRETLTNILKKLDSVKFIRTHRSYVINSDYIKEIQPWDQYNNNIVLSDGTTLKLTKKYKGNFFNKFNVSS